MTALKWYIFRAENSQQASCNWKITESHGESWQTTQQMQECTFHPVRRDCRREGSEHPDGKLSSQMPDICALFSGPEFTGGSVTAPAASRKCSVPCLVIQSSGVNCPCPASLARPSHSWSPLWPVPPSFCGFHVSCNIGHPNIVAPFLPYPAFHFAFLF